MVLKYFKQIRDTLLYFDFQPLLFFWITSDVLNNQVLWTTLSYWEAVGQPYTYWLYFAYLIASISMIILTDFKNLLITFWYAFMWTWILLKLKLELLHKSLK